MASLHSTLTDGGEPGPPHVVRFRWKPELDGELRAGRETFKRIDSARCWLRDFDEAREDVAAALEQTTAEPHPQEGEEAEATTRAKELWIRYRRDDIR